MKKHISSGAVLYALKNSDRSFLVMHRVRSNSWHLPKGTQEVGESLEGTAIREVKEETGFNIGIEKYIGSLDSSYEREGKKIEKETHYFLAKPINKDLIRENHNHDKEHDLISFFSYEDALNHLESFSLYEKEGEILKMAEQMLRHNYE